MNIVDELKTDRKDLIGADLSCADLSNSDLSNTDLRCADLRCADLRCADLRYADLCGADLRGADLRYSDLNGADLRGTDLLVFQAKLWTAYIQKDVITIGCKRHTVKEWMEFTDEEINKMHEDALKYWKKYKTTIFSIHTTLEN